MEQGVLSPLVMARGVFDRKLWRVVALPLTILQSRRVADTAKTPFFYARTMPLKWRLGICRWFPNLAVRLTLQRLRSVSGGT